MLSELKSEALRDRHWKTIIKKLGIKSVDVRIAKNQNHAFFNRQPWADLTLIAADQFLRKLKLVEGEPTLSPPESGKTLSQ